MATTNQTLETWLRLFPWSGEKRFIHMEPTTANSLLSSFWHTQLDLIHAPNMDFKNYSLPLARIKKVMKTDDDVKNMMISAEAPIVLAKACEIFILELTLRAWIQTEDNKRRTLQRSDVATAIARNDTFDFLIDIIPREESKMKKSDFIDYRAPMHTEEAFYYGNGSAMAPYVNSMVNQGDPSALLYQQQQQMNLIRQQMMTNQLTPQPGNNYQGP